MDYAEISLFINILLSIISFILARALGKAVEINIMMAKASAKLDLIKKLIDDFMKAYEDKYISREEARKLVEDIKKILDS